MNKNGLRERIFEAVNKINKPPIFTIESPKTDDEMRGMILVVDILIF